MSNNCFFLLIKKSFKKKTKKREKNEFKPVYRNFSYMFFY